MASLWYPFSMITLHMTNHTRRMLPLINTGSGWFGCVYFLSLIGFQREYDNARKCAVSKIDANMSHYGATQWDTHEGYLVTLYSIPLDIDRTSEAFSEVVQCHSPLRTAFAWNEELGKLE